MDEDSVYQILKNHTTVFMDSANLNANIASLKVNGEDLPGWNPEVYEYIVELPPGTTEIPVLEATPRLISFQQLRYHNLNPCQDLPTLLSLPMTKLHSSLTEFIILLTVPPAIRDWIVSSLLVTR